MPTINKSQNTVILIEFNCHRGPPIANSPNKIISIPATITRAALIPRIPDLRDPPSTLLIYACCSTRYTQFRSCSSALRVYLRDGAPGYRSSNILSVGVVANEWASFDFIVSEGCGCWSDLGNLRKAYVLDSSDEVVIRLRGKDVSQGKWI